MNGLLVGIEGVDGSGKTALAQGLALSLQLVLPKVILTKEPGGTNFGQQLRSILQYRTESLCAKAEYLLFAADRAQHFAQLVIPNLQEGGVVISDRTGDSSVVYQGYGRGLEVGMIKQINQWATCNLKPDLIIYLKVDLATMQERIAKRAERPTVFEQERVEFTQKLIAGFDQLYAHQRGVLILDGKLPTNSLVAIAYEQVVDLAKEKGLI